MNHHLISWLHSFNAQIFSPQVVNAAIVLPVGGVTPFLESLMDLRVAAKVMPDVTQFRNQPRLYNDALSPPQNIDSVRPGRKQAWKLKERRLKQRSSMVFNCALEFLI